MIAKPCTDATSNDDNSGCIEHISQSGQGRKHSTEQEHQKSKQAIYNNVWIEFDEAAIPQS